MKKIILLSLMLLLHCVPAVAADDNKITTTKIKDTKILENQITDNGKQCIDNTMNKVFDSYKGVHYNVAYNQPIRSMGIPGYWAKISGSVDHNYKVDIQKVNSTSPNYVANLEVNFDYVFSQVYTTKAEAETSNSIAKTTTDNYKFKLAYKDGNWIVTDAKKYDSLLGKWFTIEAKDIYEVLKCKYESH
ncbi:MAG: hypothetical protein H6Q73_3051 [Firmicutes bacterium]|nr:hypothetical protein [Bacillota bacterium]